MITKDMTIGEVIRNNPAKIEVLTNLGLGCVGCPSAQSETIQDAAMVHGIDVNVILDALNKE